MTNAEIIQAIRNEIEKRLLEKDHGFEDEADYGYHCCLKDIKHFISALESEKPIDGLEEEIKKEMVKLPFFIRGKDQIAFARHFAQWQKEQDEKELSDLLTIAHLQGADQMKEQMLKEAAQGEFMLTPYPIICLDECKDYNFKDGDKVRVIVIKEN